LKLTQLLLAGSLAWFCSTPAHAYAIYDSPHHTQHTQTGQASWYGRQFAGRRTANGERFDPNAMTAAHRTLPIGTIVRVTDPETSRSVLVRINDRGPYVGNRVIDLSERAATRLGIRHAGTKTVVIRVASSNLHAP